MTRKRLSRRPSARRAALVTALTALFLSAGLDAAEAKRLALVVGNSAYTGVAPLKNAARDATDVAAALGRLGFEVTLLTDVGSADFWDRVDAFGDAAETAESTVFFYSGHAFQMSGVNYLVPVDAQLQSREAIQQETWNLDGIIARLQDRKRQTLIFLDACRNDPLPQSVRGSGQADGLARLQTGVGTFVAFATEPGAVTYDGAGDAPNSPFTTALLKHIESPGMSISDVMIKVRNDVEEVTLRRQTPWDQSSLREQFYFKPPTESRQELSEADYELLAQLSPEDRTKFLDLLRLSGFSEDSLRRADDAITIASYNFEIAAEESVIIGVADPNAPAAPVEELPEFDLAALEVVDGGVSVDAAPVQVAEAPVIEEPAVIAEAPVIEEPAVIAEAPVVEEPTVIAEAPVVEEPAVIAEAPVVEEPAVIAEAPVIEETIVIAEAPVIEETIPVALPDPGILPPLGLDDPADLPRIRLAALTWETRGILELNAVTTDRQRVPGAEVSSEDEAGREILAAIDPRLLDDSGDMTVGADPRTLAREAQAELQRLGCYLMRVDGSWGNGSRTALTSYFLAKRQVPDTLEPTQALVEQLKRETKVVCEARVASVRVVPGKTKAILPTQAAAAPKTPRAGTRNPNTGRVVATPEERKQVIKKGLLNSGSF